MESAIQTSYVLKAAGISAVAISLLCPGFAPLTRAAGEDTAPPPEAENIDAEVTRAKNLFPLAEEVAGSRLVQKRDEYLADRGWTLGLTAANPDSAYIGWGEASIHAGPDDVKFGQSRVLAFQAAYMNALENFLRFQERRTTTETVRTFFQDGREAAVEAGATEASRLEQIWQKTLALTEAELDQKLRDLGVDPGTIGGDATETKRRLIQDSISRAVKVRALQSVPGVRTLATFEDLRGVGVLVVYSENQRTLARTMLSGRTVARSDASSQRADILRQIEATCPNGAADLAHVFGVRVMTDQHGDRVLVAFGQWSPATTRLDSRFRQDALTKAARTQALNLADGALTDFVNSTLALQSDTLVRQDALQTRISSSTGTRDVESLDIADVVETVLKAQGRATLQGVTTIKDWTANHPETGHVLVGHILMWSPSSREAAIHGLRPPTDTKPAANQPKTYENKIRTSPDFDRDADF